jgi:hypothetical protein
MQCLGHFLLGFFEIRSHELFALGWLGTKILLISAFRDLKKKRNTSDLGVFREP